MGLLLESYRLDYLDLPVPISIGIMRKEALKILRILTQPHAVQKWRTSNMVFMIKNNIFFVDT